MARNAAALLHEIAFEGTSLRRWQTPQEQVALSNPVLAVIDHSPLDMPAELRDDNIQLTAELRATHGVCDEHHDVAGASLIENWIDEAEGRTWFLYEASRTAESA